jgi:single-stranded DNA-binding protein
MQWPDNFYSEDAKVFKVKDFATATGKRVVTLTVMLYGGKNQDGTYKDSTFIDITCWNELADYAVQLQPKHRIKVVGKLTSRKFKTKDGENRSQLFINASYVEYMENTKK